MAKKKRVVNKSRAALKLSESDSQTEQRDIQIELVGSSGTNISAGYLSEEYIQSLQGTRAAEVYDKMRRSDGKVGMCLRAVSLPILGATWEIDPAGDSPEEKEQADLCRHILFNDMERTWSDFLEEALTMVPFGFVVFERVHKVVQDHPEFGSYIGFKNFAYRAQKTIERWNLDEKTKGLKSIHQAAFGDLQKATDISAQFLTILTIQREGMNFEGISPMRPAYGAWFRKHNYLKLEAIGIEKFAVPTAVLGVPEGKENSAQYKNAVAALKKYSSHQSAFITKPNGWDLTFAQSGFDPQKLRQTIQAEDMEIAVAFMANFLLLGSTGGGGSYSLSNDLSDFFLSSLEYLAKKITEEFNRRLIPELVNLNFGPQAKYPTLKASGISDKAGQELGTLLGSLAQNRYITPDDPLEDNLRARMKLPKRSTDGQRLPPAPQGFGGNFQAQPKVETEVRKFSESQRGALLLAERKSPETGRLLRDAPKELREAMQTQLQVMSQDLIAKVIKKCEKLTPPTRLSAIRDLTVPGRTALEDLIFDRLASVAMESEKILISEVPKENRKVMKLSEEFDPPSKRDLEKLPKAVRRQIESQAALIAQSQAADLEKAVYFQFSNSLDSTDSLALLEKDLTAAATKMIDGPGVAATSGNVIGMIVNKTRDEFFKRDDVRDQIETLTFVNFDPESQICQDLAGRTFGKDDPEAQRYLPPLHHNCKSYIVPNFKGQKNPELDADGLKPSSPGLEKYITL